MQVFSFREGCSCQKPKSLESDAGGCRKKLNALIPCAFLEGVQRTVTSPSPGKGSLLHSLRPRYDPRSCRDIARIAFPPPALDICAVVVAAERAVSGQNKPD